MDEEKHISNFRVIMSQVIPVLIKNILLVIIGMGIAYPTILIPSLTNDSTFTINKEEISWIASLNLISVLVGACVSGVITQKTGRKRFMQILSIPLLLSWTIFIFATAQWQILFSLFLQGLSQGLIEAPILSYVAEIAEPRIRGILSVANASSVIIGILIEFALGNFLSWRNAAAASCAMPLFAFLFLLVIPESPYWLIMHNKFPQAQKSLAWVRGWTTTEMVNQEFQEICDNLNLKCQTNDKRRSTFSYKNLIRFTKRNFYCPFALVAFVSLVSIFSGIWTLLTYSVNIYITFEVPIDPYFSTLILGVFQCLGCIINIVLIRYFGKRILSLASLTGLAILNCAIATYAYLNNINFIIFNEDIKPNNSNWTPLSIFLLMSFIANCGIRGLPWILIGEVFTHETRATGCGLISAVFYGFGFVANKTFLNMIDLLTLPGVYWLNCSVCVVGLVSFYFMLPETEGKPLQDIIDHFSGVSKLSNAVGKKNNTR